MFYLLLLRNRNSGTGGQLPLVEQSLRICFISPGEPAKGLTKVEEEAGGDADDVETEGEHEVIHSQRLRLVFLLRGQEHLAGGIIHSLL